VARENSWYQYRIVKSTKSINYLIFKAILPLPSTRKAAIFHHIRATLLCRRGHEALLDWNQKNTFQELADSLSAGSKSTHLG
jgi:hypothetical protein